MNTHSALFDLIHSLSLSEKRFFKLQSQFHEGSKNYLKLFAVIEKQKQHNEKELKNKLKHESFVKHLAYEKNYLYNSILQSLRNFHSSSTINSELSASIHDTDILYKKGLYHQCKRILKRQREKALRHERFGSYFELSGRERTLIHATLGARELKTGLKNFYSEREFAMKQLMNLDEYEQLADRVFFAVSAKRGVRSKKELNEIKMLGKHPLLKKESCALSLNAKQFYNFINAEISLQQSDWEKTFQHRKRMIELVEANPEQIKENILRYIYALNNLAISARRTDRDKQFFEAINKMKTIDARIRLKIPEEVRSKIFIRSNNLLLNYYLDKGEFVKGVSLATEIENGIEQFKEQYDPLQEKILGYNSGYIYFGAGEYKRVLPALNRIINANKADITEDLDCYARILNLITHYELGNNDLVEYSTKSTLRFLQSSKRLYEFETLLLNFFDKELLSFDTEKERKEGFRKLKTNSEKLFKSPLEKNALDYFDFISWMESKIENKNFAKIVKLKKLLGVR